MPPLVAAWNGIAQTLRQISGRFPLRDESSQEAMLYYRRACLAAAEERFDVALVFAAKALDLDPRDLATRLLIAHVHDQGLRNADAAVHAYRKVIALSGYDGANPYCAAAREALARLVERAAPIPVLEDGASIA